MFGRRSLLGIGKKAFSDPESRVIMVWGGAGIRGRLWCRTFWCVFAG
jgi:hypothetical protein